MELLEGTKQIVAIGILSWIKAERPPSGGEKWSIAELADLQERYQRGDLDSSLHSMGIGTPRGEPFYLQLRSEVKGPSGGRNLQWTKLQWPKGGCGRSVAELCVSCVPSSEGHGGSNSIHSGISGLTGMSGGESESVFSFAEVTQQNDDPKPKVAETHTPIVEMVEQLAKRLEEAVQEAQRRVIRRLDIWEPAQARLAREVAGAESSCLKQERRVDVVERAYSMKLDTSAFEAWQANDSDLSQRIVTLETFTNEVNSYLTDPNELPALAALVNGMSSFVGRDNSERFFEIG